MRPTRGRVCVNIVAGRIPEEQRFHGDFLGHDERYERTDEFWSICHALWRASQPVTYDGTYYQVERATLGTPFMAPDRSRPEVYLGGSSEQAIALAVKTRRPHAHTARYPGAPERQDSAAARQWH